MKRFQFRLEPLLRLRAHELTREQRALALAQADVTRRERAVEGARRQATAWSARGSEVALSGVSAGELLSVSRAVERGYRELRDAEAEWLRALPSRDAALRTVLEARRRLRVLELLRDRARARHRVEVRRLEQVSLDELGARRHGWPSPSVAEERAR